MRFITQKVGPWPKMWSEAHTPFLTAVGPCLGIYIFAPSSYSEPHFVNRGSLKKKYHCSVCVKALGDSSSEATESTVNEIKHILHFRG